MKSLGLVKNFTNTKRLNYNAKGEVVTANHSTNNTFNRSYEFDGIGNRKKSADSLTLPTTDNYQANALNQYGSIDGNTRSFDDDGNLVDDGSKIYTWDAENRLIAIHQREADGSKGAEIASYGYDYVSRRITKTTGATETNFIYNGWNPIAVFSGTTLDKTYIWGKDLSGSIQGAGGVGGLLSVNDGNQTYYPTFDGNGNVSEYVDTTGAVVAHYEYGVFGQVVASGSKANDFTHQFSTKQLDAESGLHYYGYRYYDSSNGRWLGRDPIRELGGPNLYVFVFNHSNQGFDYLGAWFGDAGATFGIGAAIAGLGEGIAAAGAAVTATAAAAVVAVAATTVVAVVVIDESIDIIQEANDITAQAEKDAADMQANLDAYEARWRDGDPEYYPPPTNKGKEKGKEFRGGKKKRDKWEDCPNNDEFKDWWHENKDEYGGADYDPNNPEHDGAFDDFLGS